MRIRFIVGLIAYQLYILPGYAAAVSAPFDGDEHGFAWLTCVAEMDLPNYLPLARQARQQGLVTARITLSGKPGKVIVDGIGAESVLLKEAVRAALESIATHEKCRGRTVQLRFVFVLNGLPTDKPEVRYSLRAPNDIVITSRPYLPMP